MSLGEKPSVYRLFIYYLTERQKSIKNKKTCPTSISVKNVSKIINIIKFCPDKILSST